MSKRLLIIVILFSVCGSGYGAQNSSGAASMPRKAEQVKSYIDNHNYTAAINTGESEYKKSQDGKIALYLGKAYFLKQNYQKAVQYFSAAANKHEALAMLTLGNLYGSGVGVQQNYARAVYWYKKAVDKGNVAAMNYLGLIYRDGIGNIKKDPKAAVALFTRAASLNDAEGYFNLGYLYQNAIGVNRDYGKAQENYVKSANLGNAVAMYNLAYMYESGLGVKQSYKDAMNWYLLAAAKGDGNAQCAVGQYYFNGTGVNKDYVVAKTWFLQAQKHGCKSAADYLAKITASANSSAVKN